MVMMKSRPVLSRFPRLLAWQSAPSWSVYPPSGLTAPWRAAPAT